MSIHVDIPIDIENDIRAEFPDLDRRVLENYLVEAYRKDELTSYQIRRILGFEDREQVIQFLSERGVFPNYDAQALEEDRATHARLFGDQEK